MEAPVIGAIIAASATLIAGITAALINRMRKKPRDENRSSDFFMLGVGVGNRLMLLPLFEETGRGGEGLLAEFYSFAAAVGISESVLRPIRRLATAMKRRVNSREHERIKRTGYDYELTELVSSFYGSFDHVIKDARKRSTPDEYKWFRLGLLLFEIGMSSALSSPVGEGVVHDPRYYGESMMTRLSSFESLVQDMEIPRSLTGELIRYAEEAPSMSWERLLSRAQELSKVIYSML